MSEFTISTRYVGPTDTRGARIVARGAGRQLTVPRDYSEDRPHWYAACALGERLGVSVILNPHTESGRGYRFATVPR